MVAEMRCTSSLKVPVQAIDNLEPNDLHVVDGSTRIFTKLLMVFIVSQSNKKEDA